MENVKNQEQQALEQIRAIIETLGPDSYITSALQNIFSAPSEANPLDELQQQIKEAEAHLAVLKEKLYHLTAKQ